MRDCNNTRTHVARLDQGSQAYRSNADNLAQASKQIAEKQNELGKAVS